MSRKTKTKAPKPLTAKQLADMDFKHETRKAELIGKRGMDGPVTATVTMPASEFEVALQRAIDFGQMAGRVEGVEQGKKLPRTAGEQRVKDQAGPVAMILQEVFVETKKAIGKFRSQSGPHEGYAVLKEEVDELWDEIKNDRGRQKSARTEAIQIAAMAVRYVLDNDPR